MKNKLGMKAALAAFGVMLLAGVAAAQEYPIRPITLIVPWPAGGNADVTIVCEAPRIGPHRDAMRARLAAILGVDVARISVKATTTEGLGFTGRREGIAAHAVATLLKA